MKKMLAMILALAMVCSLASCGSSSASSDTAAETAAAETAAAETAAAETAAAETAAAETAAAEESAEYAGESFTIHMASDAAENSDQNAPLVYFRDLVAEKSGGAVTVEVAWGGTEYDNAGIWEAMQNGLLDMDICLMTKHTADMPIMAWGFMPYSASASEAIEQTNYLLFENEETSAIINQYFSDINMTILGNSCDGSPTFFTTFEWDTLDDLVSKCSAFGTMNTAKYASIGLNCVAVAAPDAYDNLSRGIIDGNSSSLATGLSFSLNEVAPYATVDGQYTSSVLILANSDFYAGLSEEAKALIDECVEATSLFSGEHVDESMQAAAAEFEQLTGNPVKFLSEEDGKAFWAQTLAAIASNSETAAAGQSYEEDMKTLLTAWVEYQEEYQGIDVDWEW